jgi:ubiquinone/menaquinone biosynthesis C-methylase UbiE
MKQRQVFAVSEGNAWFSRNANAQAKRSLPQDDNVLTQILKLPQPSKGAKLLEVGFGDGTGLKWLNDNTAYSCHGIDPASDAVNDLNRHGVIATQGTAEQLPFKDNYFDVVIFGFCLYLCDRDDLFRIASEADRVLKAPGWLIIRDFYSETPQKQAYRHSPGIFSRKMDYRNLFTWHPAYVCQLHEVRHHSSNALTDDPNEWVSTSVIRKNSLD